MWKNKNQVQKKCKSVKTIWKCQDCEKRYEKIHKSYLQLEVQNEIFIFTTRSIQQFEILKILKAIKEIGIR